MTASASPAPRSPADSPEPAPAAVRIIVLTVPHRRGDLVTALPWFLGRAIAR